MNENSFLHIQVETPFKLNGKISTVSSSNSNFQIVHHQNVLLHTMLEGRAKRSSHHAKRYFKCKTDSVIKFVSGVQKRWLLVEIDSNEEIKVKLP